MDRNALVGLHNQYYQLFTKTLILICTETLLKGITEAHIQSCVSERARQCINTTSMELSLASFPGRRRNETTWQLTWVQTVASAGNWRYQSNFQNIVTWQYNCSCIETSQSRPSNFNSNCSIVL